MADFRPQTFSEIVGQDMIKEALRIKMNASLIQQKPMGHMLFTGPAGTGKTTMALVLAAQMGAPFHKIMGTKLSSIDMLLPFLKPNAIIFIDEIHAVPKKIQQKLLDLMEDFKIEKMYQYVDKGPYIPTPVDVPKFTLIGATTDAGSLIRPLVSRFEYQATFNFYTVPQLSAMVQGHAKRTENVDVPLNVARKIALVSRRTARNACLLMNAIYEYTISEIAQKPSQGNFQEASVNKVLQLSGRDPFIGLDRVSRKYLIVLSEQTSGIGANGLASMINEEEVNLRNHIEPFLLTDIALTENGPTKSLVKLTQQGRVITDWGREYLNMCKNLQGKDDRWFLDESFA